MCLSRPLLKSKYADWKDNAVSHLQQLTPQGMFIKHAGREGTLLAQLTSDQVMGRSRVGWGTLPGPEGAGFSVIRAPYVWGEVPGVNFQRSERRWGQVLQITFSLTLNLSFGLCNDWLQSPSFQNHGLPTTWHT